MKFIGFVILVKSLFALTIAKCSTPSLTTFTVDGLSSSPVCSGQLIFEDNFDTLDNSKWSHEVTLSGYGKGQFQYETDDSNVSYVKNSTLHIQPRFLSDDTGDSFLRSGTIDLGDKCTNSEDDGCKRTGQQDKILNPVLSARLHTKSSFSFRYGRLEAKVKCPNGDWLWPAVRLLPTSSKYGKWPRSGEINVMESRGNLDMGFPYTATSTLHWGPSSSQDVGENKTHFPKGDLYGYHTIFHFFQLEWTPDHIMFSVDDHHYGKVTPPKGGFWELGNFSGASDQNPWTGGDVMAPFDEEFYILINLAVGGTNGYFPETWGKPWKNSENRFDAMTHFWDAKAAWLDSWKNETEQYHFQVDYVRVWAL